MSNAPPQLVADRYRLISPLGQGGMGRVWKARDEVLHRDVAIKELVPPPSLTDEERREMRERSLREARAIARLNHINVVRIFDVLRTDGDPWIVMEYVASKSLQDTLTEEGPVSPAQAVEIGLGVLGALKAAHKAGVMHRDVKPGNVLLGNDGRVVLTDFGLATIPGDPNVTRTGMVLGSPAYIAPERARDGTAGPEADLWSLGATLYAAVEGKSPYARPSAIATLAALATEPLPPPRNAGPLRPVLNGLLRKEPNDRITAEVAERLLRRARGKQSRSISLLAGVRRPGPNGRREPRPPVVPAPRPAERQSDKLTTPPAPRTPTTGATAAAGADATAKVTPAAPEVDPTARVGSSSGSEVDPTARVGSSSGSEVDPTARVGSSSGSEVDPTARVGSSSGSEVDPTARVGSSSGSEVDPTARVASSSGPEPDPTTKVAEAAPAGVVDDTKVEVAAPSVQPAPAEHAPVQPSDGTKSALTRRNLLIGVVVAVLLLGLAVVAPLLANDDGGDIPEPGATPPVAPTSAAPPTSAPDSPAPSGTAPTSAPASPTADRNALPAGWKLHEDRAGFALPLPAGWARRDAGTNTVVFDEPNGVRELLVQWTDTPKADAYRDWQQLEPARKNYVRNYEYIDIKRCDYGRTCADWEWRETRDNMRIRVRNRGFVTASNRGYALRWEVADQDWAANLPNFDLIMKGFRPDRQD
ncbi:protein kinase [Micromonospora sp. WMMA1363]|uniref:serine/threonine-protein kinase n=1 Tax=Micromonospora sp. WMMA1363 TaxID=3053985 RepID=UPI00259CFEA4|nr:serine/threonine-protein kinase [Micromonospora sp. WMMA1363]MDM4722473.1 protein kinase [Micromonospora sp. WMMA1363]